MQPDGRLRVDFRLWDVFGETQMIGLQYTPRRKTGGASRTWSPTRSISASRARRAISTRASCSSRKAGPLINRKKRLAVMDEDGANPSFLTHGDYLVLTPRFNPTAQMIAYMSYIAGKPRVYLFDMETGRQQMLGDFPNMTFSPRFSPDGNKVVMSLEKGGNSDIYVMDLRTRAVTRLTNDPPSTRRRLIRRTARRSRSNPTAADRSRSM